VKPGSEWKVQAAAVGFFTLIVVGLVAYQVMKPLPRVAQPVPAPKPLPVVHNDWAAIIRRASDELQLNLTNDMPVRDAALAVCAALEIQCNDETKISEFIQVVTQKLEQRQVAQPVHGPIAVIHGEKVEPPTVPLALSSPGSIPAIPRPVLDDCPPGIEVSFVVVDGKMIIQMPFDDLETQIRAKMLCHIGNEFKLQDYVNRLYAERRKRP